MAIYEVFLSYSQNDKEDAAAITQALLYEDLSVFQDSQTLVAGQSHMTSIADAISDCKAVVVLLSGKSQRSRWVEKELEVALLKEKVVVPVLLDDDAKKNWVWPLVSDRAAISLSATTNNSELRGLAKYLRNLIEDSLSKSPSCMPSKIDGSYVGARTNAATGSNERLLAKEHVKEQIESNKSTRSMAESKTEQPSDKTDLPVVMSHAVPAMSSQTMAVAASTPPKSTVTHSHSLEFVKFIREEIRFQHGLLGIRISWLLAAEAFFFTAFATSRASQKCNELIFFWKYVVPFSAGGIAFLAIPAIWAAIDRIGEQRRILHNYELSNILPLGGRWDQFMHFLSLTFALIVPILFIVAWLVVGILAEPSPSQSLLLPIHSTAH